MTVRLITALNLKHDSIHSFGGIKSQSCPLFTLDADHGDEHDGDHDPAEDDVGHEESACLDQILICNGIVSQLLFAQVVTRSDFASVAEAHAMHGNENEVGQVASKLLGVR